MQLRYVYQKVKWSKGYSTRKNELPRPTSLFRHRFIETTNDTSKPHKTQTGTQRRLSADEVDQITTSITLDIT
jgi:hypothetical protein